MSQPGENAKIITRGGLVKAFERWEELRSGNPDLFKVMRTNPEWMADQLLTCLRQTHGLATLGTPSGGVPGGRPMPGHLHALGGVVQPPIVPTPADPFEGQPGGDVGGKTGKGKGKGGRK